MDAHVTGLGDAVGAWAASGAMAITGRSDGQPLGPPAPLVPRLQTLGLELRSRTGALGREVDVDALALLGERAAVAGLSRHGDRSCGGATRLLRTIDGWIAVSLARDDDLEAIPAWLGVEPDADDPWPAVGDAVRESAAAPLVERGALLGLPVAVLGEAEPHPVRATRVGDAPPSMLDGVTVLDLTSLWAGPLCGSLLRLAGARVIKVESIARPDGARRGPSAFFELLNAGKESVAIDFAAPSGRETLAALIAGADIVLEASRPRALAQLGIDVATVLRAPGPKAWVSITGYGRDGAGANRVAFGDDAAIAGGLIVSDDAGPCFCADAVADPISGLAATNEILEALAAGGRWLIDVAMSGVAASLAGPTLPTGDVVAAAPLARQPVDRAPELGEHTDRVLAELLEAPERRRRT